MLLELNIKNYALIEELHIEFSEGFNVITGETGVGKSIIVDALTMCLGNRANKEVVRTGKDKMISQAVFYVEDPRDDMARFLEGIGVDDVNNIILTRQVTSSGKSMARINDIAVNVNDLRTIGSMLVDIHSQREHHSLMKKNKHINVLDDFIGEPVQVRLEKLRISLDKYNKLKKKRDQILEEESKLAREKDILNFQKNELSDFKFKDGDDRHLEQKLKIQTNSEMLYYNSNRSYNILYSDEMSAYNSLSEAISLIDKILNVDKRAEGYIKPLEEALILIEDVSHSLREYKESVEFDEAELEDLNEKINKIDMMKKKYGPEIKDILKYKEYVEERLEIIENKDKIIDELEKDIEKARDDYLTIAREISQLRKKHAKIFESKVTKELRDLSMENAHFKILQKKDDDFHYLGIDDVEFYIKTNIGDDFKPLIKTASGGELSRVVLAIKNVVNENMNTLIFDEIDTGISGRTAQLVAEKISTISDNAQVICISHLPQIASMADTHFRVAKQTDGKNTYTMFERLDFEGRCRELAKMTSGSDITEKSIEFAREMLKMNRKA